MANRREVAKARKRERTGCTMDRKLTVDDEFNLQAPAYRKQGRTPSAHRPRPSLAALRQKRHVPTGSGGCSH